MPESSKNYDSSGNAWTVTSLHAHFDKVLYEMDKRYEQRFSAQEQALAAALRAAQAAVAISETNSDKWRANANEWRAAMEDRERKFVTRDMFSAGQDAGLRAAWGIAMSIVAVLIAGAALIVRMKY